MVLDQTLQLMVFGVVDLSGHFFMSEFSIHMPPLIRLPHRPVAISRKHENIKKREYELRIREIERASFTPIVLSSTGGMASIATTTDKRLASLQMGHIIQSDNGVASLLSILLSFTIIHTMYQRSAITCYTPPSLY